MSRIPALLLFASILVGCPGDLKNPERFSQSQCDVPEMFANSCGARLCHGADADQFDLVSAGLEERLTGVMGSAEDSCDPYLLLNPANPAESLLYSKLSESTLPCGDVMPPPLADPISAAEIQCVLEWVQDVAAASDAGVDRDAGDLDGGTGDGGTGDAGSTGDDSGV